MAHVSEFKKKIVEDITKLSKEYPIIGVVNMENLPASQLQTMKAELRGKVDFFMTKKRLMKIAIEKVKSEKKGLEQIVDYFEGMPALIFTRDSPFKLSKILRKSKTSAPAKSGQTAPNDIIVRKGPTPFAPGPVISELSSVGLKVGVEGGKVAVKEDTVVVKQGEKISAKVAEILTRLDIKPMEVGLDLMAAYENGVIYLKDILDVDEAQYANNINLAAVQSFNLAFDITYVTKDNAGFLIGKAFNDAKALGFEQEILDTGIIEDLLGKAQRSMLSLQNTANIEVTEKPKEKTVEEKPQKEVKEETVEEKEPKKKPIEEKTPVEEEKPKEKPKVEEKKEETKPEVKEKKIEIKEVKEPEKKIEEKPEIKEKVEIKEPIKEEVSEKDQSKVKKKVMIGEIPAEKVVKEPEIKEEEKEEDIYEEESREKLLAQGEISPAEEGFMRGYEEAGKTIEEKKPQDEVDKKVTEMVEKTKKFMKGEEETAEDILEEVKKEEKKEIKATKKEEKGVPRTHDLKKEQEAKTEKKDDVPSAHDLQKEKEEKEHKEVEELTKELLKKGTLRKK